MRKIFCLAMLMLTFTQCKKNASVVVAPQADVTIKFNNKVGGQSIEYGKYNYTNAAGNIYSINLLKYYITNVVLITDGNTEVKLNNYDLINAFEPAGFSTVEGVAIPNGTYKTMRFFLGVDQARNHNGAQDGDLDPAYNMIWSWFTGYIFLKHEGKFINSIGDTTDVQFHLGTDNALSTINIPIDLTVNGAARKMNIDFDLNKMYNSPLIDFNNGSIRQSTDIGDLQWINDMIINSQDAFTFVNVE